MAAGRTHRQRALHDSIALFAYYGAVPVKPDFEEMSMMNRETVLGARWRFKDCFFVMAYGRSCRIGGVFRAAAEN